MSVQLQKGQKVSLSKDLNRTGRMSNNLTVGLGWDEKPGAAAGHAIDCDSFAILLTDGRFADRNDVIYFGNRIHPSRAVQHMGDNLTGAGDGDDEQIRIFLPQLPAQYDRIVIGANIYKAAARKQHFGMVRNAFIRLVDSNTDQELCIYSLTDEYKGETAMIFGELYRYSGDWKFSAAGRAVQAPDIRSIAKLYA